MTATLEEVVAAGVPGTEITSQWIEVTPEMARDWLKNNTKNRHLKDKHLRRLVKDMSNDKFVITHQGVAICEDGTLIDGQHRLSAIAESEKSQWLLITTGLPMDAQMFVDNGARRMAADLGPLKEGGYGAMKAAVIKILLQIEDADHKISPQILSNTANDYTYGDLTAGYVRYEDMIEKHLTLSRAAAKDMSGKVGGSALLAAAVYYPERATEFLTGIATGADLGKNDPRLALRRYRGPGRVQVPLSAFVAFKAARYFHHDAPLSVIKYRWNEVMDLTQAPRLGGPWGGKKNGDEAEDE